MGAEVAVSWCLGVESLAFRAECARGGVRAVGLVSFGSERKFSLAGGEMANWGVDIRGVGGGRSGLRSRDWLREGWVLR